MRRDYLSQETTWFFLTDVVFLVEESFLTQGSVSRKGSPSLLRYIFF